MKKRCLAATIVLALVFTLIPAASFADENLSNLTPYDLKISEIAADSTHPYGSMLLTFKIDNLPRSTDSAHWEVCVEKKIGDGDWIGTNGIPSETILDTNQTSAGTFELEQLWVETYEWDGTKQISYRVFVKEYDYTWTGIGQSGYSNIASAGMKSSSWAVAELEKAESLGLIPNILKGADLTKPITREEFAELAVLMYEKVTATTAVPADPNPFKDTNNAQILKAFSLGITKGISDTTFEPNTLINREQCAAMLFRAIKAVKPDGDYGTAGVADFADQKQISAWASDATKYMAGKGIIKGDSSGKFMPKATTTVQQAANYGMSTREAAILMTVRAYEAF